MAKVFTITEGLENMGALKTGGQGSVYKGRRVGEIITAIKLIPTPIYSETPDDKNYISFQNEVQKLKKVNETPNPNVVKILSSGVTDSGNFPFIEMEFIEGPDLEELLKPPHEPVFTIKEVLKVADQLSNALAHIHKLDVKHGDIKSNNVKYNTMTGNYILLDFGLAVMSDEQRRTSLRHAGAIEFMAPEQNEGRMLFETDVYSFGVILFELLAGRVPFPLNDKSETGRNTVMLAHLESTPPDLLALRQQYLPADWDDFKKGQEMQVPDWLVALIYKCLEKKPEDRFENGVKVHEYIWLNTIQSFDKDNLNNDRIKFLEQENKRLLQERDSLQEQLSALKQGSKQNRENKKSPVFSINTNKKSLNPGIFKNIALAIIFITLIGVLVYYFTGSSNETSTNKVIGEYMVTARRAYFHNSADESTRRNAFAVPGKISIKAFDEKGGFIYTEITNEKGQTSKGWLSKKDLIDVDEWAKRNKPTSNNNLDSRYESQLQNAREFLTGNKIVEALVIYNTLAKQQVPEAMYQYGKLALQNINENISCEEGFDLVKRAADKGYVPAKRSLGLLYSFADNQELLKESNYYQRCVFGKNVKAGSKLLMEAMLQGDTAAARLITILNQQQ